LLLERDSICDIMAKFELMTPPKSKEALHFVFQVPDDALPCQFPSLVLFEALACDTHHSHNNNKLGK